MFHVRHSKEGIHDSAAAAPAHSTKAHGAQRHKPLIFSLGTRWRKVSTSRCGRSTTGENPGTQWTGIWVHTAAVLRVWGKEKLNMLHQRRVGNTCRDLIALLPGHYTAWSIYCQVTVLFGRYTAWSLYCLIYWVRKLQWKKEKKRDADK